LGQAPSALRDLVVIVLGPPQVLGEELAGLGGVSAAAIFGSWAARALGEAGASPVDLLVIGRRRLVALRGISGPPEMAAMR
jgi:predicted nucleotidyltransferase